MNSNQKLGSVRSMSGAAIVEDEVMSKATISEIEVNGVQYVPKGSQALSPEMGPDGYCIVRTRSAGVFAGYLKGWGGGLQGTVTNARRLWYWKGACSLSQLAMDGVKNPGECKFAMEVPMVALTEIIEVLPCTKDAFENIKAVPVWKK